MIRSSLDKTSQRPLLTLKPWVPHPGLFPTRMSFRPSNPLEYNIGFNHPSGGFPALILASFSMEMIDAKVGVAADAPPIKRCTPARNIR